MSFMRVPNANLDAKFLAKKPTKPGGQRRRRGGRVPTLCKTVTMSKTPTAHPTPSLPPLESLLDLTTSHPVGHQPTNRRQVCPPPEREA